MAESSPPRFVMQGARIAMAAGLSHIQEQVKTIEQAVVDNPGLAFDLAKTIIESTCRTILTDRHVGYSEDDDLPGLFRMVRDRLSFLPPTASSEAGTRRSLEQTLNGLNTALHGICELRNHCGFASHGPGRPRPTMETAQALLAAEAADAMVGFLYRVHLQDRTPIPSPPRYDAHPTFNDYIDNLHEVIRVFESMFRPSEVLFHLEPESYRIRLAEYADDTETTEPVSEGMLGAES